jgi:hypothetical protein
MLYVMNSGLRSAYAELCQQTASRYSQTIDLIDRYPFIDATHLQGRRPYYSLRRLQARPFFNSIGFSVVLRVNEISFFSYKNKSITLEVSRIV